MNPSFCSTTFADRHVDAVRAAYLANKPTARMLEGIGHPSVPTDAPNIPLAILAYDLESTTQIDSVARSGLWLARWMSAIDNIIKSNGLGTAPPIPVHASFAQPAIYITTVRLSLLAVSGLADSLIGKGLIASRPGTLRVVVQAVQSHERPAVLQTLDLREVP